MWESSGLPPVLDPTRSLGCSSLALPSVSSLVRPSLLLARPDLAARPARSSGVAAADLATPSSSPVVRHIPTHLGELRPGARGGQRPTTR
jgi:hypothetical protein